MEKKTPSLSLLRRAWNLASGTVTAFWADHVPRLGAALAFYTTIAVVPLLILTLLVAGQVFEDDEARERVIGEVSRLAGTDLGQAITVVGRTAATQTEGALTGLSLVTLLFGTLAVFRHLQGALNWIWKTEAPPHQSWRASLRHALASLGTVAMTGFLLQASLVASAVLTWLGENAAQRLAWPALILEAGNFVFTFVITTYLFALIFRLLPQTPIRWREVWLGAALTAAAFVVGKTVLALYLARSQVFSAYGVAGSVMALLLWTYYMSQIVFLGAEFTRVHQLTRGGRTRLPSRANRSAPGLPV